MPRNKLPLEQKKVRLMTIYVEPKFATKENKKKVNQLITKLTENV